ncbi:Ppx/GppA family phosphatase [Geomonas nitrogeniifigens]|uniref:Ppx/GppA family phosphatase n=1 Tax=Geomonas diazotrophica TaxID=2843197 RepID=A0ABX8JRP3_9BACT|nr:Ppx/GppA phosphatase family protein [Geomonas nitrogeniifigens]QWV99294.1 Ppx/GppA family phosphatase [Geomonas nitrogeniifigens]QXE88461.1 Ppx/GppA family phosphatase [Geomonas nitrogeniifigens]
MTDKAAAIDLGTNTARLQIATQTPYRQVLLKRIITRLGGGFTRETGLSPEAQERSIAALGEFASDMASHGVVRLRAVATSAVRDAKNGADFCRRVLEETGIALEVIDGSEEAMLTLRGVASILDNKDEDLAVFDVGGGSTEYTLAAAQKPLFTRSLPVGVVRLTEGKVGVAEMEDKIRRELRAFRSELAGAGLAERFCGATLVGTAGTATTLASIDLGMTDYDYKKVNNHTLSLAKVEAMFDRLLPLTPRERLQVPGLEPGREDLIIAGILVVLTTMREFGFPTFKVSDAGLLEGLILGV